VGKAFSKDNQPSKRRGPNKLKKAIPLFEQLGINPLVQAIKNIKKISKLEPDKAAKMWIEVAKFIYPHAKEDEIPSELEESLKNQSAQDLLNKLEEINVKRANAGRDPNKAGPMETGS
jgi:hypothetical protein